MHRLLDWLWLSALPRAADIAAWRPASVVDLTQRPRPHVARACHRLGITYVKAPVSYAMHDIESAVRAVLDAPRPVLVHCFHGRDRAPRVCRQVIRRSVGRVVLHGVGRNLNRAYRACSAFGVPFMDLHQCTGAVGDNLFSATNSVTLTDIARLPPPDAHTLWLSPHGKHRLDDVPWIHVRAIVVGGETDGLPRTEHPAVRIQQPGSLELTVESALSIALYAWGNA